MKGINNMRLGGHSNRNGEQANAAGGITKTVGIAGSAVLFLAVSAWVVALAGKISNLCISEVLVFFHVPIRRRLGGASI